MGNLTRDPEIRYTPKGSAVTEIAIAVNRYFSSESGEKREETTFVDVVLWGRTAEIASQYLAKGRPVLIEGRLQLDTWEDKQTGQKRSRMRVVGESMQLIGAKPGQGGEHQEQGENRAAPASGRPGPATNAPRQPSPPQQGGSGEDVEDDDIPF